MAQHRYSPQLATLVAEPPSGDNWLHEIKFDGYRIGACVRNRSVTLFTRNGNDWTAVFPEIADAVQRLAVDDTVIDGEAAVVLPDGRTSFQALQNASTSANRGTLVYFVFDVLRLEGENLEQLPLDQRKARLGQLVGHRKTGRIRFSEHVEGHGREFFAQACRLGLEGIVSKRRDLPHKPGRHSGWLKIKCVRRQEFVIGGFTDPEGTRAGLGALLIGYYDGPRLVFSGKVGTGFTHKLALELRARLDRLVQKSSPFDPPPTGPVGRRAHWVKPELVAEVVFTEWTGDGKIRHPSFQGLRRDKKPADVTREQPALSVAAQEPPNPSRRRASPGSKSGGRTADAATAQAPALTGEAAFAPSVAGVRISHPDRVVYPDIGLTKLDVAHYYDSIADWIVPHAEGRPLTLVRCPDGLKGECFFMKHSKVWAPPVLRRVRIREQKKVGDYLIADDIAGIVGLAQMGVLEIHTWNSVFEDVERPNRIVFDLDPGEHVGWTAVVGAARMVREGLAALEFDSYVKTTGGRGLHVVVPLVPHADWSDCLEFARRMSQRFAAAHPELYTTAFAKAGRSRTILIDYLRNNRTNTSICGFSTRARAGAPVSLPVTWEELRGLEPQSLTIQTVPKRLGRLRKDPWEGYWKCRQKLSRTLLRAVADPP